MQPLLNSKQWRLTLTPTRQAPFTAMFDTNAWEEYCEASLDLSNQDDVGDPVEEPSDAD
jgi:hypothetical protein